MGPLFKEFSECAVSVMDSDGKSSLKMGSGLSIRTVSPSNSSIRMFPPQYPIPWRNRRICACAYYDAKALAHAHYCTSTILLSLQPVYSSTLLLKKGNHTLRLIQSDSTFASAHLFVLGGRMIVEPNMMASISYAS